MRFPAPARWPFLSAAILTPAVLLVVALLTYGGRILESIDHSFFDLRTALLGDQRDGTHPDISVVLIGETSVAGKVCRSPMDREMLATIIRRLDALGAKAIALDFIFDQPTLPQADKALTKAFDEVSQRTPVVLAAYDERFQATPAQYAQQNTLIGQYGLPAGYVNITKDYDGSVRRAAPPTQDSPYPYSFPQQIARAYGFENPTQPDRISWLIPPERGDTFGIIGADELLQEAAKNDDLVRPRVEGKIVLVGANLLDQRDSYRTPLSFVAADNFAMMPGVFINAHMVAQLIDDRNYTILGPEIGLFLAAFAAFGGALYGWYFRDWRGPVNLFPVLLFFVIDVITFSAFRVIIPFSIVAVAWVLAAWLGKWIVTKEVAHADA